MFKVRLLVLGLLAVMAFGAVASGSASAAAGPFWHQRSEGKGEGEKISSQKPENFVGEGSGTELTNKMTGIGEIKMKCNIKTKGSVWNVAEQGTGQMKAEYENCSVNTPAELKECKPQVASEAQLKIWLDWKYEGKAKELSNEFTAKELGQKPDFIVYPAGGPPVTLKGEELTLEPSSFARVKFPSKGCGVLGGVARQVEGATGFNTTAALEEFHKEITAEFPGGVLWQQDWWQGAWRPFRATLIFAGEETKFSGSVPAKFEKQEVAVFEK